MSPGKTTAHHATSPPNPPRSPDEPCTELPCHHDGKSPGTVAATAHHATAPPNPPRSPDEPCTELPCHHDGKSPGTAAADSTVHHSAVHHSPASDADLPSSASTELPSTPPSASDAETES